MKAFLLVIVLFTNDGDVMARVQPVREQDACQAAGANVVKDLNGKTLDMTDGTSKFVLDAQYFCFPVEAGRSA